MNKNKNIPKFKNLISILLFFTIIFLTFNSRPTNAAFHFDSFNPADIICPTPNTAKNALQLFNCFINTPTPTPIPSPTPQPSPTTPPPASNPESSTNNAATTTNNQTQNQTANTQQDTQELNPQANQALPAAGQNTQDLSPQAAETQQDPCSTPPSDYESIRQSLSTNFQINLTGDADANWASQAHVTICKLNQSSNLSTQLFGSSPINLNFTSDSCTNLRGNADMATGITITGTCDNYLNRAILVHELGHMYAFRNPSVYNNFLNTVWPAQIPTYNCQIHYGDGPTAAECFADGFAENVVYSYLRLTLEDQPAGETTFPEYPTTYSNYYNSFNTNAFAGETFTTF